MRASDRFQQFLSESIYLAQEPEIMKRYWKEEHYQRLQPKLHNQVIHVQVDNPDIEFQMFLALYAPCEQPGRTVPQTDGEAELQTTDQALGTEH